MGVLVVLPSFLAQLEECLIVLEGNLRSLRMHISHLGSALVWILECRVVSVAIFVNLLCVFRIGARDSTLIVCLWSRIYFEVPLLDRFNNPLAI